MTDSYLKEPDEDLRVQRGKSHHMYPNKLLDHAAVMLDTTEIDWRLRSFRFVNAWPNHPGFMWKVGGLNFQWQGGGSFQVFQEISDA